MNVSAETPPATDSIEDNTYPIENIEHIRLIEHRITQLCLTSHATKLQNPEMQHMYTLSNTLHSNTYDIRVAETSGQMTGSDVEVIEKFSRMNRRELTPIVEGPDGSGTMPNVKGIGGSRVVSTVKEYGSSGALFNVKESDCPRVSSNVKEHECPGAGPGETRSVDPNREEKRSDDPSPVEKGSDDPSRVEKRSDDPMGIDDEIPNRFEEGREQLERNTEYIFTMSHTVLTRTNDFQLMNSDHTIHFIPAKCHLITPISQQFLDDGLLQMDQLRTLQPALGQVLTFKTSSNRYIFNLVAMQTPDDDASLETIRICLDGLKTSMD